MVTISAQALLMPASHCLRHADSYGTRVLAHALTRTLPRHRELKSPAQGYTAAVAELEFELGRSAQSSGPCSWNGARWEGEAGLCLL